MKVVLISCVSPKKSLKPGQKVAAKDLYVSPLFRMAWQYAEKQNPDSIYILSAKYGLIKPDCKIATYNKSLNNVSASQRKEWSNRVIESLLNENVDLQHDEIIILAGHNYSRYLTSKIANCRLPYRENKCKGIGYILKFLKNEIGESK